MRAYLSRRDRLGRFLGLGALFIIVGGAGKASAAGTGAMGRSRIGTPTEPSLAVGLHSCTIDGTPVSDFRTNGAQTIGHAMEQLRSRLQEEVTES